MKYLIVYKSRHGTTRKVVQQLVEGLAPAEVTTVDLGEQRAPDLNLFDAIIIGGSIHAGQIQKDITKFCRENRSFLLAKPLGVFICFMNKKDGETELRNAYPFELLQHATANGLFGGELLFDKMNFLEKLIVRKVSGVTKTVSALDEEAIRNFILKMRAEAVVSQADTRLQEA